MPRVGPGLLVAAVGAAVLFALFQGSSVPDPIGRGSTAPDFSLPSLAAGEVVRLGDLRGRVVLVNFWATWCKPCEDEMPAMQRLYEALSGDEFELLAVSVDDQREPVERFRERLGLTFPVLWDPKRRTSGDYQAYRFPETLLIDREGMVVERYIGPREWDAPAYQERIRHLLARTG